MLTFEANKWFTKDVMKEFANIINAKGAPITNCIGFIDGTARKICRPSQFQKEVYSGHKRAHVLKFQNMTLPNGIILQMSMPYLGKQHDCFILRDTGFLDQMSTYCKEFCVYGDKGEQLMRPFSGVNLSYAEKEFNRKMSQVRQCVEWSFGKIIQQFAFLDFNKNLKLFLQPVGQYYFLATLMTNAHTCFYGSQTCNYFDIECISIYEYFQ